jgi:cellulase/cellobiase CelA1
MPNHLNCGVSASRSPRCGRAGGATDIGQVWWDQKTKWNDTWNSYRAGHTIWCNPPNAAAGTLPTTKTGNGKVDAFMWVERPGFSNGSCNGGPAKVGAWWEKRAIQMVERAKWFRRR